MGRLKNASLESDSNTPSKSVCRSRSSVTHQISKNNNGQQASSFSSKSPPSVERMHLYPIPDASVRDKPPQPPPVAVVGRHRRAHAQHVLHRHCHLEALNGGIRKMDAAVVIVYSKLCQVSCQWASYLRLVLAADGNASVELQDVQHIGRLVGQLPASKTELTDIEEKTHHAACQVVVVDETLLNWIYGNPSMMLGHLFRPERTLGLLLGVRASDVKPEHRAALLTFSEWKLLRLEEDMPGKAPFSSVFLDAVRSTSSSGMMTHVQQNMSIPTQPPPPTPIQGMTFTLWPSALGATDTKFLVLTSKSISPLSTVKVNAVTNNNNNHQGELTHL